MNLQELGLTLQREREKKGLTIEVVVEATKISRTNIVALENGDKSSLPHPVYAKGFIKSYARYLGLDPDELSMIVDREYQDEIDAPEETAYEVSPTAEKAFHDGESVESTGKSKWPLLLAIVAMGVVVVFLVMNFMGDQPERTVVSETVEEAVEQVPVLYPEPQAPEVAEDNTSEVPASLAEQPEAEAQPSAPQASASQPVKQEEKPTEEPKVVPQQETPEVKKPEKPKYDHILIIRATTEKGCWIGVWKGDEVNMARDFVLKEGEPLRLMFNSPRRIRIGNVSGVTVTYNGEPYPLDQAKGNIQTLRFGMESN